MSQNIKSLFRPKFWIKTPQIDNPKAFATQRKFYSKKKETRNSAHMT